MYEEGGVLGNFSYISRAPPTLKRVFLYELFLGGVKLRDYLKRRGVVLIHFQYLASKACLEKGGEAVSYIDFARPWMFDVMEFSWWILRNSTTLLSPPWNLTLPNYGRPPWVNTQIWRGGAKFGRGGRRWSTMNVCTWGVSSSSMPHLHYTWRLSWEA